MYYIFNDKGQYLAGSNSEPNLDDLATRDEQAVKSDKIFANPVLINKEIVEQLPTIDEQRQQVRNAINALRDKTDAGGVFVEACGKWIDSDDKAYNNILVVKANFDLLGDRDITWTWADNTASIINRSMLASIVDALSQAKETNHKNALRHKAAVEQSENPLEYDYSTGWTTTYEEYYRKTVLASKL